MLNPQLNRQGRLVHLLSTEGLSRALTAALIEAADAFVTNEGGLVAVHEQPLLGWRMAVWGGDDVATPVPQAALTPFLDSCAAIKAQAERYGATLQEWSASDGADMVIVRHPASGAAHWAARRTPAIAHIVNAGDGCHADPVSGLMLVAALRRARHDLTGLTVAFVGNLTASAPGRSCLHSLTTLGVPEVRLAAPPTLAPDGSAALGVQSYIDVDAALVGADVVIVLPMHAPDETAPWLPSVAEYHAFYGLTRARLAAACPNALVLFAGPLQNGREIEADLPHHDTTVWGAAVSRAVLATLVEAER